MKTLRRTVVVLWHIVPIIVSFVRDFKGYLFWGKGRNLSDEAHLKRAKHLTKTLGYLGPTFIKLAQVLSARADVLLPVYILELSTLQDKVTPNPVSDIKQVISEDLHDSVDTIFDEFDDEALAAASLGQVHRARHNGEAVVVKVLRPGVPQLVRTDLMIIHTIIRVLNICIRNSSFLESLSVVINEFHRVILEEMDFELEAHNVKMFQRNFAGEADVIIPEIYDEFTTKRVLVLEYVEGVKINEVKKLEQMGIDVPLILQRLAKIYIHQVVVDGVLHADPHPGNILVDRQGRILILDFGMVIRIDDSFKQHLIKCAVALARKDIDGMVNELYELRIVEPGVNKAALRDLAELLLEIQEQGKISSHKVQQMTEMLMEAFHDFPFTVPSEFVYIGRAASLIEGIGFIHDPWFDSVEIARPILKDLGEGLLKEELRQDIPEALRQFGLRSYQSILAAQDIILKTDREQLRIRLHPSDLKYFNTMMGGLVRKVLAGVFIALIGFAASLMYLRDGNPNVLILGLVVSGVGMLFLILLPDKQPETKHQRYIRKHVKMISTEEGEIYRSLVVAQMGPEERKKAEARRKETEAKTPKIEDDSL